MHLPRRLVPSATYCAGFLNPKLRHMLLLLLSLVLLALLTPGNLISDAKPETPPIIIDASMEDAPMQTELPMGNRASVGGLSAISCAGVNNAPVNRSLPPAAPSGNADLSPRAASLLNEHLIALLGKEWTRPVDGQDQSDLPGEHGPVSLWAYRAGLMEEWYPEAAEQALVRQKMSSHCQRICKIVAER